MCQEGAKIPCRGPELGLPSSATYTVPKVMQRERIIETIRFHAGELPRFDVDATDWHCPFVQCPLLQLLSSMQLAPSGRSRGSGRVAHVPVGRPEPEGGGRQSREAHS